MIVQGTKYVDSKKRRTYDPIIQPYKKKDIGSYYHPIPTRVYDLSIQLLYNRSIWSYYTSALVRHTCHDEAVVWSMWGRFSLVTLIRCQNSRSPCFRYRISRDISSVNRFRNCESLLQTIYKPLTSSLICYCSGTLGLMNCPTPYS